MPNVGVLNLQVHDDSAKALSGLDQLASALFRVKSAVQGAKLGSITNQLNSLKAATEAIAQSGAAQQINKLALALERLKNVQGIKLPNLNGMKKVQQQMKDFESIGGKVQNTEAIDRVGFSFEEVESKIESATEEFRHFNDELLRTANMDWTNSSAARFADMLNMWLDFKSSRTIGSGNNPAGFLGGSIGSDLTTDVEKGWTNWKNGAIEVEGTVVDAMEHVRLSLDTVGDASGSFEKVSSEATQTAESVKQYGEATKQAFGQTIKKAEETIDVYTRLRAAMYAKIGDHSFYGAILSGEFGEDYQMNAMRNEARNYGVTIEEVKKAIEDVQAAAARARGEMQDVVQEVLNVNGQQDLAGNSLADSAAATSLKQLNPELQEMREETLGAGSGTEELTGKLKNLDRELKQKKTDAGGVRGAFEQLKNSIKNMLPSVSNLSSQFARLIKYRVLRNVIKEIAEGFSLGVENVYRYSKAIGGSFSTSMDSAASSLLQMKNAVGAAAAPAIQALIPIMQTLVSWFITAINYLNQFLSLLRGQQSWTRATPTTTKAFDDVKKSAKGAGAAMKDLLADWDELNIIQSEGGGGGGGAGGKAMQDYLGMFEEVYHFNNVVKNVVDVIRDKFGNILNLAGQIGAALLGWKVSTAFTGLLGTLGGLIAGGAVIKLMFDINSVMNDQYFKTGEDGWLIGNVLTTMVGATLMSRILRNVLGGQAASIAIPLTLALSAAADLDTYIRKVDVSALSELGLKFSAMNALKVGTAAGYIAHLAGKSLGASIKGGAAAALLAFGIAISLKADAEVVADGITETTVRDKLAGILATTAGGAAVGGAIGKTAAAAAGMGMLFGGASIATFGISVGINAINESVNASAITPDVIKKNFLASGLVGTGLALVGTALGLPALAMAGGGAIVTLAALFGIEAVLSNQPSKVRWGNYEATREAIQNFVSGKVFIVSPKTIVNLTSDKIAAVKEKDAHLTAQVEELQLEVTKFKLSGGKDNDVLTQLQTAVFGEAGDGTGGIMGDFKELAKAKQTLIETGITLSLIGGQKDDGTAKSIIDENGAAWKAITGHMDTLGKELSQHFFNASKAEFGSEARAMEIQAIQDLTTMMANVTNAVTQGEAWAGAQFELAENLESLTKDSWDGLLDYIDDYKSEIIRAYTDAYDETGRQMGGTLYGLKASMENALELAGGDTSNADYQMYKDAYENYKKLYEEYLAGRKEAIEEFSKNAMDADTMNLIRETLMGLMDFNVIKPTDTNAALGMAGLQPEIMDTVYQMLFPEGKFAADASERVTGWFNDLIGIAYGSNADTIIKGIESGLLFYSDFINEEIVNSLANNIGIGGASDEVKAAWDSLISGLLGQNYSYSGADSAVGNVVDDAVAAAETVTERTRETVDNAAQIATDAQETIKTVNDTMNVPLTPPNVEDDTFQSSLNSMVLSTKQAVARIKTYMSSLNGLRVGMNTAMTGAGYQAMWAVHGYAGGGVVRSGDLVMANENGNFEMMGSMGGQPVVANNQQIVEGITRGVASGQEEQNVLLRRQNELLSQLLRKEFVARVSASSGLGRVNSQSDEMYSRMRG